MNEKTNPYRPVVTPSEEALASTRMPKLLSRPMAVLVGVFVGSLSAVVVGEMLSLIALFPPLNHWLDFDGEFSGLILIGMPMLAGACGALAGLVLGLMYRRAWCRLASVATGSLPAVMYCAGGSTSRESVVCITAIGGIMILATLAGVMLTHSALVSIDRRRSSLATATNTRGVVRTGRFVAVVATLLALISLFYDAWLWRSLGSNDRWDRFDANPVPDHCFSDLFLIRKLARTVLLPPIAPNMDLAQRAANDDAYSTDVRISTILPR